MRRPTYIINLIIQGSTVSEEMPGPENITRGFWWKIVRCLRHVQFCGLWNSVLCS